MDAKAANTDTTPVLDATADSVRDAFAWCERLARSHYENFPVGSVLLPSRIRRHVWAIYAFARIADDFADEESYAGERLACLGRWRDMLRAAEEGRARHPVFVALVDTLRRFDLPAQLLHDLITAFEMDCRQNAWPTWDSLLHYSSYSANPVGRLVLWLHGYRDEDRARRSDAICTALQLTNFWQDVSVDLRKDRVYIPEADMERHDYVRIELERHFNNERLHALMRDLVDRTRALYAEGDDLPERVRGLLRYELRLTCLGGKAILDEIEARRYNVFERPTLSRGTWLRLLPRMLVPATSAEQ